MSVFAGPGGQFRWATGPHDALYPSLWDKLELWVDASMHGGPFGQIASSPDRHIPILGRQGNSGTSKILAPLANADIVMSDKGLVFDSNSNDTCLDLGTWGMPHTRYCTLMTWIYARTAWTSATADYRFISSASSSAANGHNFMHGFSSGSDVFRCRFNRTNATITSNSAPDVDTWYCLISQADCSIHQQSAIWVNGLRRGWG